MRRTQATLMSALSMLCLASVALADGPPRIFILLPSQSYVPGVGIVGAPGTIRQRQRFIAEAYAVDEFGNVDFSYEGEVHDVVVAGDVPPPGEPPHPRARRFGTSISGEGAAAAIPPGSLRVSLGGSEFKVVTHGGASTPQGVCDSIVTAIHGVEPHLFGAGELDVVCRAQAGRYRFFAIVDRTDMNELLDADIMRSITFDPSFGSAVPLKLGALYDPDDPSDPNDPLEFVPRNVEPYVSTDLRFSRGVAVFEVMALHVSGPGQTLQVDQGSAGLEVVSTPFAVQPLELAVESVRLRDVDSDGSIDSAIIRMSEPIDALSLPLNASDFTLTHAGSPPIHGTFVRYIPTADPGFDTSAIEVTFGSGIGKTDVKDVEVSYTSPSGMVGAKSGTVLVSFAIADSTSDPTTPRLIDGAPPVLVSTFAQDIDGNNGLDRMQFVFSEPVKFSAGRGMSFGAGHDPALDPNQFSYPNGSLLRTSLSTLVIVVEDEVTVVGGDPNQPMVVGAAEMDGALTAAIRRGPAVPAWINATASFEGGRYILRAGIPGVGSSVTVQQAGVPDDLAPLLKLGAANGGVERPGHGDGIADLDSLVIRGADGANLLLGKTESDVTIDDNVITIELTNVPNSGTATPTYLWRDDGDSGFITDTAKVPNYAEGMNNVGLDVYFNPKELLVEASSTSGSDLVLRLTKQPGAVTLDASQSILPLTSVDDEVAKTFTWTQVDGPFIPAGVPPNNGVVTFTPTVAGTYVFDLVLTVPGTPGGSFNAYLEPDRTLRRTLELTVTPGPAEDVVILLPGQSLSSGVASGPDAVTGTPKVATVDIDYEVELVSTDAFHNETPAPPGAMGRITTTDPLDVEPPFQPFAGSRVRVRITPSDAATVGIPTMDDQVVGAFEHGDIHYPYIVGSLWNVTSTTAEPDTTGRVKVKFAWLPDSRALEWNIYRGSALALADVDRDGLPDLAYGTCVTPLDPDPTDALFEDATEPAPGGIFIYLGTMDIDAFGVVQETSLGRTRRPPGLERPNLSPCP